MKHFLTWLFGLGDRLYNFCILHYRGVSVDGKVTIHGKVRIFGQGAIRIGRGVTINSCLSSNPIGGDTQTVISVKAGAVLTIGENVGISNAAIVCHDNISIGAGTLIGGSVKIYDTDFHALDYRIRGDYEREEPVKKPVVIGENVFIGAHSILLKGVTIGDRSIIGAGSVVTKDVGPDEVWAGNPARRIRQGGNGSADSLGV